MHPLASLPCVGSTAGAAHTKECCRCPHLTAPSHPWRAQVRLGPLTPSAVRVLRHVRDFLKVQFELEAEEDSRTIFGTCVGAGLKNLARKTD